MQKHGRIILLQEESEALRRLAERRGMTPGDVLRALILSQAYQDELAERVNDGGPMGGCRCGQISEPPQA